MSGGEETKPVDAFLLSRYCVVKGVLNFLQGVSVGEDRDQGQDFSWATNEARRSTTNRGESTPQTDGGGNSNTSWYQ